MVAKAGILMLAAAMWVCLSAVAAFDVPSVAFDEGFSPLFGDDNLVRARDDQSVRLLLDRRSGNLSPSSQSTPPSHSFHFFTP
jgi:xyloglucan:xyloglucosyl transferase